MTKNAIPFSLAMLAAAVPVLAAPAAAQTARAQILVADNGEAINVSVPQSRCRQEWNSFDGPADDWVCPLTADEQRVVLQAIQTSVARASDHSSIDAIHRSAPIHYTMLDARGRTVMQERGVSPVEQPETCGRPAGQSCGLAVIFKPRGALVG